MEKQQETPIVLEMMTMQIPKQKPLAPVIKTKPKLKPKPVEKQKIVKTKPAPKPPITPPKRSMIAKAKPGL